MRPAPIWISGRLALLAIAVLAVGCGQQGPKKYPVEGTVTWEGQPLPDGHIVFASADQEFGPDAGLIENGKFAFESTPGPKKVEIDASRVDPTGKVHPTMGMPAREAYIPARYNTETELTVEVKEDGENTFEFNLTQKP